MVNVFPSIYLYRVGMLGCRGMEELYWASGREMQNGAVYDVAEKSGTQDGRSSKFRVEGSPLWDRILSHGRTWRRRMVT